MSFQFEASDFKTWADSITPTTAAAIANRKLAEWKAQGVRKVDDLGRNVKEVECPTCKGSGVCMAFDGGVLR